MKDFCVFCKGELKEDDKYAHKRCIFEMANANVKYKVRPKIIKVESPKQSLEIFAQKTMQLDLKKIRLYARIQRYDNKIIGFEIFAKKDNNSMFRFCLGYENNHFRKTVYKRDMYSKFATGETIDISDLHYEEVMIRSSSYFYFYNTQLICENSTCLYKSLFYCRKCRKHFCGVHFRYGKKSKKNIFCNTCRKLKE